MVDNASTRAVGTIAFARINPEHGSIEAGHVHFSKLLKRSSAATEAMFLMMTYHNISTTLDVR